MTNPDHSQVDADLAAYEQNVAAALAAAQQQVADAQQQLAAVTADDQAQQAKAVAAAAQVAQLQALVAQLQAQVAALSPPQVGSLPVGQANYPVPAAGVLFVSLTGDDSASGSLLSPMRTVPAAVKRFGSSPGTVVVRGGVYPTSFATGATGAPVTVQNYPGEPVWFDGGGSLHALVVESEPVSWRGVGVRNFVPDGTNSDISPIYDGGSSAGSFLENVVITNIMSTKAQAAQLNKPNITVHLCTIDGMAAAGIGGDRADNITIDSCLFRNVNASGAGPASTTGAVKITRSRKVTLTNNRLESAGNPCVGLWVDWYCTDVTMRGNTIVGPWSIGLNLEDTEGYVLDGNTVTGAGYAAAARASGAGKITRNRWDASSGMHLWIAQDRHQNPYSGSDNYMTPAECPWQVHDVLVTDNDFGGSGSAPQVTLRVQDTFYGKPADSLGVTVTGNRFHDPRLALQWGSASYQSVAALQAATALASGNTQG